MLLLDCTLRDGGYYNSWDFSVDLIEAYLKSVSECKVDIVEIGFRSLLNAGFKGACFFSTDDFLNSLSIPSNILISVMVNGSELVNKSNVEVSLKALFPNPSSSSVVDIVRIACHFHELEAIGQSIRWLHQHGYRVGLNIMQISERTEEEISSVCEILSDLPLEVLYIADSLGSLLSKDVKRILSWFSNSWSGSLGIHTHNNMGLALQNTLDALDHGVTWVDTTVTGMGRGPGNTKTEEFLLEIYDLQSSDFNVSSLMALIEKYFQPLKDHYGWGTNPYYFLAGKNSIHPTFIQEMLGDARYTHDEIIAVIQNLSKRGGGYQFSSNALGEARNFYPDQPTGRWNPISCFSSRDILILGSGPSVCHHKSAIESYIRRNNPIVIALNTGGDISNELIDYKIACHPVRLLADVSVHINQRQPLISPFSLLPEYLKSAFGTKDILDYGLGFGPNFEFHDTFCIVPNCLVIAYALSAAVSGNAKHIYLAGFDGYTPGDPRNDELELIFDQFINSAPNQDILQVTPSKFKVLPKGTIYSL
ncbi:aldolase catalytic domain-containing protein [bacterium]|nr:aldolase catalytic domain-containing protein [bacterium]